MPSQRGRAYSQDLHERVFAAWDDGERVGEVAELLRVSVRMARPVCKDDFTGRVGLHQRIRSQGLIPGQDECARLGPNKVHGVRHHIFDQATKTPARPLRHLFFTSTDLVCVSGAGPRRYLVISSLHDLGVQRRDRDAAPPRRSVLALAASATTTTLG